MAAFHQLDEVELDTSRYSKEQIEQMRRSERVNPVKTVGLVFTAPFRNFVCPDFDYYCTLFGPYDKHGVLPYPGTFCDQPSKIIEVFNTLRALVAEMRDREQKKELKKNGTGRQRKGKS